jgi:hypothetical protein
MQSEFGGSDAAFIPSRGLFRGLNLLMEEVLEFAIGFIELGAHYPKRVPIVHQAGARGVVVKRIERNCLLRIIVIKETRIEAIGNIA